MNTKLICQNCGHSKLNIGNADYDEKCEICGGNLYPENETQENEAQQIKRLVNQDIDDDLESEFEKGIKQPYKSPKKDYYTLGEVIEMDLIKGIEDSIKGIGHKRTWEAIEALSNAKQRIVFRKAFEMAKGIVPENSI